MKLIVTTLVLTFISFSAHSLEKYNYKDSTSTARDYDQAIVEKVWASDQPACIKDGGKILTVNKAFKSKKLGHNDCSSSDLAKLKQKKYGYSVTVFKLAFLPKPLFDQVVK